MKFGCCDFFKAVSDSTRIKIMWLLKDKDRCVSDICKHFNMKQPSITHHLKILKNADIVTDRKEGKEVYYSLKKDCIFSTCEEFMEFFE